MSLGLHWLGGIKVAGSLRAEHLIKGSLAIGRTLNRMRGGSGIGLRWDPAPESAPNNLVQSNGDRNNALIHDASSRL